MSVPSALDAGGCGSASGGSQTNGAISTREKQGPGQPKLDKRLTQRVVNEFDDLPMQCKSLDPVTSVKDSVQAADEMAALRKALDISEITREMLQRHCDESVEKTVLLTLQHQQALQLQQMRQSADCQQSPLSPYHTSL